MSVPKLLRVGLISLTLLLPVYSVHAGIEEALVFDLPSDATGRIARTAGTALSGADSTLIASQQINGPVIRLLVVPVEWIDRPRNYSRATLDSLIFSEGVWPGGSVVDYYNEVAYGQVTISGTVLDWQNAGLFDPDFDFESLLPALDAIVDFSEYDGNGDGAVDAVTFVRSGTGEEDSHDEGDIWSYAMVYTIGYGPGPFDGVRVSRWNTCPEAAPLHDPTHPPTIMPGMEINHIRVFCHELAHNLGLPDLYDYDGKLDFSTYSTPDDLNDHPVYDWDIMGYGGYGYFSIGSKPPSHLCGWSKMVMGWLEPIPIGQGDHEIAINNIETTPLDAVYRIDLNEFGTEYFLLEYRNPYANALFDKCDSDFSTWFWQYLTLGNDTLDRGLLITHVDETASGYWSNDGFPVYANYRVMVEDAGYNPALPATINPEGHVTDSAQWWYPYETRKGALFSDDVPGQSEFGPTTYPSSDTYWSGPSGVYVRVDSIVGSQLYAFVSNPSETDIDDDGVANAADNCPSTANPDQIDSDLDGFGDLCDNCPTIPNYDQLDPDLDSVGSLCDNCPNRYNPGQEDTDGDLIGDHCDYCCLSLTGNVDDDPGQVIDLSDVLYLANATFLGGPPIACRAIANVDGDPLCVVDIGDILYLAAAVFLGGPNVYPCMPDCHVPGQ